LIYGTVDSEFLVQMLQLKHGSGDPSVRVPGTLDALSALEKGVTCRPTMQPTSARATASNAAAKLGSA
jgi:hypothetical protein